MREGQGQKGWCGWWVGPGIGGNNSAHEGMWGLLLEALVRVERVI
jgi:hypothetical protein